MKRRSFLVGSVLGGIFLERFLENAKSHRISLRETFAPFNVLSSLRLPHHDMYPDNRSWERAPRKHL